MSQPKVVLGNINPGQLSVGFVQSLLLSNNEHLFDQWIFHPNGPYLDMGRNVVVREFMKLDADYLLFIDSDIEWTTDDLKQLYSNLSPDYVLGGYYLNPYPTGVQPVVYEWEELEEDRWSMLPIDEEELLANADDNGLASCTAIGTGFMCIPRKILEACALKANPPLEYFCQPVIKNVHLGEDLGFCLRVHDLGFDVKIDCNIKLTHNKMVKL